MGRMRIGQLSARTGVSRRLLRYYEEQGLLRPLRRASGYREYAAADVEVVRSIRSLLAAGLNTATIAEILPCMVERGDGLAPACPELLPDLRRERERLDHEIVRLQTARAALNRIIAAGSAGSADDSLTASSW
jgi:DNA-binding transcriptional MerR regulator